MFAPATPPNVLSADLHPWPAQPLSPAPDPATHYGSSHCLQYTP